MMAHTVEGRRRDVLGRVFAGEREWSWGVERRGGKGGCGSMKR